MLILKQKKGFVFTSIVLIVFLFLVALNPISDVDTRYTEIHKWQNLIKNSNQILKEIESYQMPLVIRSVGYSSIKEVALNEEYSKHKKPYANLDDIKQALKDYMIGKSGNIKITLDSFLSNLSKNLKIMNYDFTYDISQLRLNLNQSQAFKLNVNVSFPYNLSAKENEKIFKVERNATIFVTIPLIGINDPLTTWATKGKHNITIEIGPSEKIFDYEKEFNIGLTESDKTLIECHKQYSNNIANSTCMEALISKHWFIYSEDAPSFLNRLLINFSPSRCCGITTILNESVVKDAKWLREASDEGLTNWSYADYCQYQTNPKKNCFFSNRTCKLIANESVEINGKQMNVLIDLYNYHLIMNLTAYALKDDSETIEYDSGGSCLTETEISSG